MPASPMVVGRSYIREQRPKRSIGYIHPTTPLPDAEVSFLTGEVIHQAGMEQRSGFEPPLSVWRTDVLPLHKRCECTYRFFKTFSAK